MIYIVTIYKNYYDHYGYTRSVELQYGAQYATREALCDIKRTHLKPTYIVHTCILYITVITKIY